VTLMDSRKAILSAPIATVASEKEKPTLNHLSAPTTIEVAVMAVPKLVSPIEI
jgi:hypothetical protein